MNHSAILTRLTRVSIAHHQARGFCRARHRLIPTLHRNNRNDIQSYYFCHRMWRVTTKIRECRLSYICHKSRRRRAVAVVSPRWALDHAAEVTVSAGGTTFFLERFDRRRDVADAKLPASAAFRALIEPDARVYFRGIERAVPLRVGYIGSGRDQLMQFTG